MPVLSNLLICHIVFVTMHHIGIPASNFSMKLWDKSRKPSFGRLEMPSIVVMKLCASVKNFRLHKNSKFSMFSILFCNRCVAVLYRKSRRIRFLLRYKKTYCRVVLIRSTYTLQIKIGQICADQLQAVNPANV